MDTRHLNAYVNLIEALLQCAKGEEWLLLQQHQDLVDAELLTVMAQVAEKLNAEGNAPAAQFLRYWTLQLTHLLQQNTAQTPAEERSPSYLQLIQTLLGCEKGDEAAILSQHPELMDEGLVYTMKQVAAQLAAQGNQDVAIYLKHLAAEIHHSWLQPNEQHGRSPISSPPPDPELLQPPNGHSDTPIDPGVATANNRHPSQPSTEVVALMSRSAPPPNNQIEELLANISSRLEKLEVSTKRHSTPHNPLWYMPILEQVDTHGWIISSEEVEQLIGTKPHCAPGDNSFVRGCWKFIKVGKIGTHSSWQVVKEIATVPSVDVGGAAAVPTASLTPVAASLSENRTPEPELSSPWTEIN
jgi:hypothetical protein